MEKESYSIDEILSEVKKRREEQEEALKSSPQKSTDKENKIKEEAKVQPKKDEPEFKEVVVEKKAEPKPQPKPQSKPAPKPKAEKKAEPVVEKKASKKAESEVKPKKEKPLPQSKAAEEDKPKIVEKDEKIQQQIEENVDDNGMVDLLHYEPKPEQETEPKQKFFKTKKGKIVKWVIIVLVIAIVAAGVFAAVYVNKILNNMTDDTNDSNNTKTQTVDYYDMDALKENFPTITEPSAGEIYNYREFLKQWYQNGEPCSSSHVLNVLLIGEDTRETEISDASRADSAIIASINIDTGKIQLTSLLRDLFVYFEKDGEGHYGKLNESASIGGVQTYIQTVENVYKIKIDNYVIVNFASFPKIIDSLGGVNIKITDREINEINNHQVRYNHVTIEKTFEGTEGTMTLNGKQALAYCRIRKIDSDNARADRQKTVLNALFNKAKKAGTIDALKLVNELSGYTKTDFSKKALISIGNRALRDNWLNYQISTTNVPSEENSYGSQYTSTSPNNWIWIADIPKEAHDLQTAIYGKSSIQLQEEGNRPNYIQMGK